jgi:hypothetical protein
MRPASITSIAGISTVPPASVARAVVASTSAVATYEFQCGGMPCCGGSGAIAAACFPPSCAMEYTASSPIGASS